MENFDKYLAQLNALIEQYPILPWAVAGVAALLLLILIIVRASKRARKRRKAEQHAPILLYDSLQVAPLGKDIYFKIKNAGHKAIMEEVSIKGRKDVKIGKAYEGFVVERGKAYSIFFEAATNNRIAPDFELYIHYKDELGNQYRQPFDLSKRQYGAGRAKLTKYA